MKPLNWIFYSFKTQPGIFVEPVQSNEWETLRVITREIGEIKSCILVVLYPLSTIKSGETLQTLHLEIKRVFDQSETSQMPLIFFFHEQMQSIIDSIVLKQTGFCIIPVENMLHSQDTSWLHEIRVNSVPKLQQNQIRLSQKFKFDDCEEKKMSWYRKIDNLLTIEADKTVEEAYGTFAGGVLIDEQIMHIHHMGVTEKGELIGIITKYGIQETLNRRVIKKDTNDLPRRLVRFAMITHEKILKFGEDKSKKEIHDLISAERTTFEIFRETEFVFLVNSEQKIVGFATLSDLW